MEKLVVVIMGGPDGSEKFIEMCLESVKDADAIVYCDGMNGEKAAEVVQDFHNDELEFREDNTKKLEFIENKYDNKDKQMNGKQRNFYLDYIKKNYKGWFCLALDADEVVEDLSKIKDWINKYGKILEDKYPAISPKMRHLIQDLSHEDASLPEHYVPNRLFKIVDGLYYPEIEHPVLQCEGLEQPERFICKATTIWHLSYITNLWHYKKIYEHHLETSTMHTPLYLRNWYYNHIFGEYPKSKFNPIELPAIILKSFGVDKDELYFMNRRLEPTHFIMMGNWLTLFEGEAINILDLGCGFGHYGYAFDVLRKEGGYSGWDISQWAIDNSYDSLSINKCDIVERDFNTSMVDLVLCVDILEHIKYEDLDKVLNNIKDAGEKYIFSIPFIGDPNLEADATHIIKESKEWWIDKLSKYFMIKDAPEDWAFNEQILIGEKNDKKINV